MSMLIIADDLSGAADCAIGFASCGLHTVVALDPMTASAEAQVTAADTDTRRLSPGEAAMQTAAAFKALIKPGQRLYKKIDSTLRGNWAAEVAALQPLAGLAIVAPAFPATGRTLQGGRVLVNGEPLESTETWKLENADRPADVAAMLVAAGLNSQLLGIETLRGDSAVLAAQIVASAKSGVQALIVDAYTAEDLLHLAQVTAHMDLPLFWVGSGGLAREIAKLPDFFQGTSHVSEVIEPVFKAERRAPILIMVGSLSGVSVRQCDLLKQRSDVVELIVPPAALRPGADHNEWSTWQTRIGAALNAGNDLLLRIGRDAAFDPKEGAHLSSVLAKLVKPHFGKVGGLIATGGETARAMLTTVGIGSLQLLCEIEAGVAFGKPIASRHGHCPGVITKAGAFGTEHALYAAWLHLSGTVEPN